MNQDNLILEFLKKHPDLVIAYLEKNYPFSKSELRKYRHKLCWDNLSDNENLPWSIDLFKEFDEELTMTEPYITQEEIDDYGLDAKLGQYYCGIYFGKKFPWTIEFIDYAKDKLTWFAISQYWELDITIEVFERYADYWDYFFVSSWNLEWTTDLVEKFKEKWDYWRLCGTIMHKRIGDYELILKLKELAPKEFEKTKSVYRPKSTIENTERILEEHKRKTDLMFKEEPWTEEELFYALNNWSANQLVYCDKIAWTPGLVDYLSDRDDWEQLFNRSDLPITEELIEKYYGKIPFGHLTEEGPYSYSISRNTELNWSIVLLEKYRDDWFWIEILSNESIPKSDEFIDAFSDKIDWKYLCYYWGDFWDIRTINKYKEFVCWDKLSSNSGIDFNKVILLEFESKWNYAELVNNSGFISQNLAVFDDDNLLEIMIEKFS